MKKNPKKTAQTKAAIKAAFWTLYRENPITKITVQDVTNLADFNRSTFYQYFHDVYCLLEEIEDDIIQDWQSTFSQLPFHSLVSHEVNEDTIEKIAAFYGKNGDYLSILLSPKGDPAFIHKLKNVIRPKIFSRIQIQDGNMEAMLAFEFVSSGVLAFISAWHENARTIPLAEAIEFMRSLFYGNIVEIILKSNARIIEGADEKFEIVPS